MRTSQDVLESYVVESAELLDATRKNVSSLRAKGSNTTVLNGILRNLHTIKGNARMLSFSATEKLAHALEDVFKSVQDGKITVTDRLKKLFVLCAEKLDANFKAVRATGNDGTGIEPYLTYCDKLSSGELIDIAAMTRDITAATGTGAADDEDDIVSTDGSIAGVESIRIKLERINEIISSFDGIITREFRLKHGLDDLRELEEKTGVGGLSKIRKQLTSDIDALESYIFNVQQQIFDLRMLPLSMVLDPLTNSIQRDAITLGKDVVCDIPETGIRLDKMILEQLTNVLTHLVRNGIDHGIEPKAERVAAGKPEVGTISIHCEQTTNYVDITVGDDGRGLDYEKIRAKALALYPEKQEEITGMGEKELASYLFMPGFTTQEKVTDFSGRGVGLDVVRTSVEKIKGRIRVESEPGKGTRFVLTFPLSLATLQGLFIYSGNKKFLLPAQYLVDIVYRTRSEFLTLQNHTYIQLQGELIPLYSLASLLDSTAAVGETESCNIVIAEYLEQKVGILVDKVLRYVSLVVKPLPPAFERFSILQGIVFDEHYSIVPILYVPDIITRFKAMRGYDVKKFEARTRKRVHRILVADDSETTRHIESSLLTNEGYVVDTAVDGIDGLEHIKEQHYDLIITDVQMPRMDGKVFLDNIRRNKALAHTPVIVISSVVTPELEKEFIEAGATLLLNKSNFKRSTVAAIVRELLNG